MREGLSMECKWQQMEEEEEEEEVTIEASARHGASVSVRKVEATQLLNSNHNCNYNCEIVQRAASLGGEVLGIALTSIKANS